MFKTETTTNNAFTISNIKIVKENQEVMKKLLYSRLTEHGIKPEIFSSFLKTNNAVLTGSLPLQTILGEKWIESDIDIFITNSNPEIIDDIFVNHLKLENITDKLDENEIKKQKDPSYKEDDKFDPFSKSIIFIRNYLTEEYFQVNDKKSRTKVQVICVSANDIYDYIDKIFDLSFCKITYDGDSFRSGNDGWIDISEKKGTMEIKHDLHYNNYLYLGKHMKRMEKYQARGFQIKYTEQSKKDFNKVAMEIYRKYNYSIDSRESFSIDFLMKKLYNYFEYKDQYFSIEFQTAGNNKFIGRWVFCHEKINLCPSYNEISYVDKSLLKLLKRIFSEFLFEGLFTEMSGEEIVPIKDVVNLRQLLRLCDDFTIMHI